MDRDEKIREVCDRYLAQGWEMRPGAYGPWFEKRAGLTTQEAHPFTPPAPRMRLLVVRSILTAAGDGAQTLLPLVVVGEAGCEDEALALVQRQAAEERVWYQVVPVWQPEPWEFGPVRGES